MASPPRKANQYAYVTLITRASYLAGVVILAHTLRKRGSKHPLVVLYTPSLSADAVRALELESSLSRNSDDDDITIALRPCAPLLPPSDVEVSLIAARFEDTWTKLRVFEHMADRRGGGGYDAVCYLDADVAVFRNPDAVFARAETLLPPPATGDGGGGGSGGGDWLGASHACVCNRDADPWAPADWRPENCAHTPVSHPTALAQPTQPPSVDAEGDRQGQNRPRTHALLNGGMFVFRPSRRLWEDMLGFFETTPLLGTFKFPDQDFLAHFFAGRWRALGWQYNALKTMRYWHANIWRDDEVVCLHYVVDKPWTRRVADDGVAGYRGRDGVTHRWWWDAYDAWEGERMADPAGGREVVALVRKGVAPPLGSSGGDDWGQSDPDLAAIGGAVQAFANNNVPTEGEDMAKREAPKAAA